MRKTYMFIYGFMIKNKDKIKNINKNEKFLIFYKKLKKCLKGLYGVASVVSTLTIFLGGLYYLVGQITNNNQSDNDLIMQQIKDEICDDEQIVNMENVDIHGFGNNSIIVTSCNAGNVKWDGEDKNKFVIMDSVENEILHSMNDLLGVKSRYKPTFTYSIEAEGMHLYPVINCVSNIFGDSTKEILINYYVWGSTYSAYYTAIFRYSYEHEKYEIVGTYPIVEKNNLTRYDENGNIVYNKSLLIDTKFNQVICESKEVDEFCDFDKSFNLTAYSGYCRDYWAEFSNIGKMLVVVKHDRYDDEVLINCYQPSWKETEKKLRWNTIYSEYTSEILAGYTKDDLAKWIENKFNCHVSMY